MAGRAERWWLLRGPRGDLPRIYAGCEAAYVDCLLMGRCGRGPPTPGRHVHL